MHWRDRFRRSWHRVARFLFLGVVYLFALILFLVSQCLKDAGNDALSKVLGVTAVSLQGLVGVYFEYKMDRERKRRSSEVLAFRESLERAWGIFEQVKRAQRLAGVGSLTESDEIFYTAQEGCKELVSDWPPIVRISSNKVREEVCGDLETVRGGLEAILSVSSAGEVSVDWDQLFSCVDGVLAVMLEYEQAHL